MTWREEEKCMYFKAEYDVDKSLAIVSSEVTKRLSPLISPSEILISIFFFNLEYIFGFFKVGLKWVST